MNKKLETRQLLTYLRNGTTSGGSPLAMDNLTYNYLSSKNQLGYVADAVNASNYTTDIDNQAAGNYSYDAIGNLIKDNAEGITDINWSVYGKILSITKSGAVIRYVYDASGNRIFKYTTTDTTAYVRDASGNVMSVYVKPAGGSIALTETHLYGSSRLGMATKHLAPDTTVVLSGGFVNGIKSIFARGEKLFELANHLQNVLVTISDKKIGVDGNSDGTVDYYTADVITANDYYVFGMQMPGRTYSSSSYRYGFNGKEEDDEVSGDGNQYDYGMRIYNPRLGRFLSVDPLGFSYPWYTPYQFAGNTPIQAIDMDGGEPKGYQEGHPYGASHPGTTVKGIPSQYDHEAWMVGINGGPKQLMHVYAVQDIDKKTYLIYETATGAKAQWYIEYDKNGYKGDVNSFTWSTPPDPSDVLYAMTVGPLVALPGLLTYGPALLRYLAIETGKEIVEEAAGVPIFDGPIDAIKQYEKRKLTKEAIKQSFEHLGKNTEESVRKKLKDYVLNTSHPVGGSKAKWFKSALGFTQENMDDLAKQIKFDKSKAIKTELTEYGQKYNQVINITGANGKKIDVTFGFIENKDGVVRMTTAIPTKQ